MTNKNNPLNENMVNELNYLREDLNQFIESGNFETKQVLNGWVYLGVKGNLKILKSNGYTTKNIKDFLNLLEFGLNNGLVCPVCLKVGVFSADDVNCLNSKCLEHGGLI